MGIVERGVVNDVPLEKIRPNPVALRPVDKKSEEYQQMLASVKRDGVHTPILARPQRDENTKEEFYELIDGLQRFNCAIDAGIKTLPLNVKKMDDDTVLITQVVANIQRIETKPKELADQINRLVMGKKMTVQQVAEAFSKSVDWVLKTMKLHKIENQEVIDAINSGRVPVTVAYELAKLPTEEQIALLPDAISLPTKEAVTMLQDRKKQLDEDKKKARDSKPKEFDPKPVFQKSADIKEIYQKPEPFLKQLYAQEGCKTLVEAGTAVINWLFQVDKTTLSKRRADWERAQAESNARKAERQAQAKAKRQENLQKKEQEAGKEAAAAQEQAKKAKKAAAAVNAKKKS